MGLKKKISNFLKPDYKTLNCGFMINPYSFVSTAVFDPNSVTGLVAWYDANDSATITKSADRVSQWNDKSSQGNNLVQATGADQPLWVNAVQNGKPIIRFDGVSEHMEDLVTNTYTQPTTLFMVCSTPTENGGNRAFFDGDSARNLLNLQSPNQYRIYAGASLIGGTLSAGFKLFRAKFNGASSSLHINNSSILSGDAGTQGLEGIIIGALNGFTGPSNFDVCEVLFYDANVSAGDITSIESYLNTKWGL